MSKLSLIVLLVWLLGMAPAKADLAVVHQIDFAGEPGVSAYQWLEAGNFQLQHDAKRKDKILLSQSEGALQLEVLKPAFGLILHELHVPDANHLRIRWGVSKFPKGASYEQGVDDESIMVYVFFGDKKLPSGSLLIPDSPYFIGFFLCPKGADKLEKPYTGRHFKKSGRFICLEHSQPDTEVETQVDLVEEFRKSFQLDDVPPVSSFSIELDTTHAKGNGAASAFLKRIEFLK